MDPKKLLEQVRAALAAKLAARKTQTDAIAALRAGAAAGDAGATDEAVRAAIDARNATDAEIDTLTGRETELVAEIERESAIDRLQADITPAATPPGLNRGPAYDRVHRVGQEERTYSPGKDRNGRQFLRDVGLAYLHGARAIESNSRLDRHMAEERVERGELLDRAAGSGAFAGLVVPQYLTDMYAPLARSNRPFADACNDHPLPEDGMTVNISRITTGTSSALQASENAAVSNTDIDDTLLTVPVQTNAGQQTLSRQAIERGTGTEDVMLNDLFRAHASTLDATLITQATTGLSAAATSVAYTDASPTVAEAYPKIIEGLAGVEAAMLDMASGDNLAVMHSRRWYWLNNAMTSTWPSMSQPGIVAQMLGANYGEVYGRGVRGVLPNGTPVIVDNNLATTLGGGTEDEIYLVDRQECHLWEDPNAPMLIRAEQPAAASLGVLFVVYSYFAYTFTRYAHARKVSGTGLIAPTFTGV